MNKFLVPPAAALCLLLAAAPARAQLTADARRTQLDAALHAGDKDKVDAAFADLRQWFLDNPVEAENAFWKEHSLLIAMPAHAGDMLEFIEFAKDAKKNNRYGIGYLYALQAIALCQLNQVDAAKGVLRAGLKIDAAGTAGETIASLDAGLEPSHQRKLGLDLLQQIIFSCADDLPLEEAAVQERAAIFQDAGDHASAKAEARRWFNLAPVAGTREPVEALIDIFNDDPLDAPKAAQLRTQQADGAQPIGPEATPVFSTIIMGIPIDSADYAPALERVNDNSYAGAFRHAVLLLAAGQPDDALKSAQAALEHAAGNAANLRNANDLIARIYKAQDGTTGRALAYLAAHPNAATASRPAPSAPAAATPASAPARNRGNRGGGARGPTTDPLGNLP